MSLNISFLFTFNEYYSIFLVNNNNNNNTNNNNESHIQS